MKRRCFRTAAWVALWAASAAAVRSQTEPADGSGPFPDFHIGNSITVDAQVRPQEPGVDGILASVGIHRPSPGWQLASGTGLFRHFTFTSNQGAPFNPSTNAVYGRWDHAFAKHRFHAVTLQPWVHGATGMQELEGLVGLITALRASPLNQETPIYLYTAIPGTPDREFPVTSATTLAEAWNAPLSAAMDTSPWERSKAGVDWIAEAARQRTGETLGRIPLGDVLAALDVRLREQPIGGFRQGWDLYRDHTHLNFNGSYVASLTMATALYDIDPLKTGLGGRYKNIDPAFAEIVKEVVSQVLRPAASSNPPGVPSK